MRITLFTLLAAHTYSSGVQALTFDEQRILDDKCGKNKDGATEFNNV